MILALLMPALLAVVCLAVRLRNIKKSMSRAAKELDEISRELMENRVVKLSVPERDLEELFLAINSNLDAIRQERLDCEKKERELKEQVENISHDLRTPLTAILGYLKMIDREELGDEPRECLETALKKAVSLQELITQFYDLSRITSADFQLKLVTVDAGRLLRECCLEHYALLEQADLRLHLDIPREPVLVEADPKTLERIFSNLLGNAVRYARSELTVTLNSSQGGVEILFQNDVAPGMEITDPSRLFERFYMQEESSTRGGSGLGLTISQELACHMNVRMEAVCQETGEGQKLSITLRFGAGEQTPAI